NVQAKTGEEKPGEAADNEKADETEGVKHRRIPRDGALVKGRSPVKDLDRRGNRHEVAEERKRQRRVGRFAGNEHVMRPNQEADDRDGDTGAGDERVAEDRFARVSRNDLADHAHGRKNHDVHGGVRIEPEEMLKEDRIATESWIEEAEMKHALEANEQ